MRPVSEPGVPADADVEVDVAVVGGGGAGLCLLHQLALRGPAGLSVAVLDPLDRLALRPDDRTWCFWDGGTNDVDEALTATWSSVLVRSTTSRLQLDLPPMRYAMLRSGAFAALVAGALAASSVDVRWLAETVTEVEDGDAWASVRTPSARVRARWVFDSRPGPVIGARTSLLQHFRGAFVHAPSAPFDAALAVLMDFTTPQPVRGLSFGYCLPVSPTRALVEYTEFSPQVLPDAGYAAALDGYLARAVGADHVVEHVEQGVIPMSDAAYPRRTGRRTFRAGTAGGATRGSTGYTFAAMQRQARAVAEALRDGRDPEPPAPYPARHRLADAVLLRALDSGAVDGPGFFTRLFERNPPQRVLRFLDGATSPGQDLALVATAPPVAMTRSAAWVATHRRR